MIAYLGFHRDTEIKVTPINKGCGAGQVTCFECGGDGDWSKFHPDPSITTKEHCPCVDCKGTGLIYISI